MNRSVRAALPGLRVGAMSLDGRVFHHLVHVLRLREGDRFVAFDPTRGEEADALVTSLLVDHGTVELSAVRPNLRRASLDVTLVQGIAKSDKCDAIVRDATELGASSILFVPTSRSVVKLDRARRTDRLERWNRIAEEAARQCRRAITPTVTVSESWSHAVTSVAPATGFCLYEESQVPIGPSFARALEEGAPLAFAIGPEGGFSRDEVEEAERAGWQVRSLGPLILRTETVAAAVLGAALIWGAHGEAVGAGAK